MKATIFVLHAVATLSTQPYIAPCVNKHKLYKQVRPSAALASRRALRPAIWAGLSAIRILSTISIYCTHNLGLAENVNAENYVHA